MGYLAPADHMKMAASLSNIIRHPYQQWLRQPLKLPTNIDSDHFTNKMLIFE
jgi:hypothetical protein